MSQKKVSKFLSYVLRHNPSAIDLNLNEQGWASIEQLLQQLTQYKYPISHNELLEVVKNDNKQRFKVDETGLYIRANQGHSISIDLGLEPTIPPTLLYHGTAQKNKQSILNVGLQKRNRHQVHLSSQYSTAVQVGSRHGKPLIFMVDTPAMQEAGHLFYQSDNGVWLTDHVPSQYLKEKI
ncbi:MAG: RNA 2'-phosphotransferase [Aureispira sp.]